MSRKLHIISIFCAIAMIISNEHCFAQNIYANGNIDRDSIFAGQPFNYKIDIKMPKDYVIEWTTTKDTLNKSIEVIKRSEITNTPISNGDMIFSQTLTLTSFDTGYVEIPPIGIKYSKSIDDTTKNNCFTEYMYIYVEPISIDTTMAYRPIKMPIKQGITFIEASTFAGGVIILAGLILLAIYLIKRSKNKDIIDKKKYIPEIPAIVTARERLSQLKEANLWQSGKSKEYYTDLTDIAREYLEGQFNIDAIEMTSDEILEEVKKLQIDKLILSKLEHTLTTADLVKFAKANPSPTENETAFCDINSFVEESYIFHQEMEKKKAEEAKAKKNDIIKEVSENQEMEETL